MAENKTEKYHIPHRGIYMYSHVHEGKTEMIVLNSTGSEQILDSECYTVLTKDSKEGRDVSSGKKIDLTKNLVISPRKSLIIEF